MVVLVVWCRVFVSVGSVAPCLSSSVLQLRLTRDARASFKVCVKAFAGEKGVTHDAAAVVGVMEEQWLAFEELRGELELVSVKSKAKAKLVKQLRWMRTNWGGLGVLLERFDGIMAKF